MEAAAQSPESDAAKALQARIRQLKFFLVFWVLVALLYGAMFVLTWVLHGSFDALFFIVTVAMTGGAVLDVIRIRSAKRQLRAVQST
jgi:DMSO reductase anchor subunit